MSGKRRPRASIKRDEVCAQSVVCTVEYVLVVCIEIASSFRIWAVPLDFSISFWWGQEADNRLLSLPAQTSRRSDCSNGRDR